jgi:hypothetical protein
MNKEPNSPYDRGDSDRYYGRRSRPHKRIDGVEVTDLTPQERDEYNAGWDENRSGTKEWR